MSAYAGTAFVEVRGDFRELNRGLAAEGRALASSSHRIGRAISQGLRLGIVSGGIVAFQAAKQFSDFELQMQRLRAEAGASQREVDNMTKAVMRLTKAGKTKFTANEISQGLFYIESHGYRASKALKVLHASIDLATAGNADLISTSRALNAVLKSHITPFHNVRKVAGLLNAAVGEGSLRMQDLINALGTGVVPAARTFHLKLNDVTSALAVLTRTGATAQLSATRLRYAFALLAAPSAKATDIFNTIGLKQDSLAKDMRKPRGLLVALKDLRSHLATLPGGARGVAASQALSRAFGGARSFATISALVQNLGDLSKVYDQTAKKARLFNGDVAAMNNTAANKFHRAWSVINSDLIELGKTVAPFASAELLKFVKIFNNPNLSTTQKFSKVFSIIGSQINDVFSSLGPKLLKVVETLGPKVALALINGFIHASVWTRLFVGGYLVQRFIGWGRIFGGLAGKAGATAGTAMGTEMSVALKAQLALLEANVQMQLAVMQAQMSAPVLSRSVATGRYAGYTRPVGAPAGAGAAMGGGALLPIMGGAGPAAGEAAATGWAAGFKKKMRGLGPGLRAASKLYFGLTIFNGVLDGINQMQHSKTKEPKGPTLGGNILHSISLGALPNYVANNKLGLASGGGGLASSIRALDNPHFFFHGGLPHLNFRDPEKALRQFGDKAQQELPILQKLGQSEGLHSLAEQARELAKTFPQAKDALGAFAKKADQSARPFDDLNSKIEFLKNGVALNLRTVHKLFRQNLTAIEGLLGTTTAAGAKKATSNFSGMVHSVRSLLRTHVIDAQTAFSEINKAFVAEAKAFGLSGASAKQLAGVQKLQSSGTFVTGRAMGGYVGAPGEVSGDNVPMFVPHGTGVFTRHQMAALGFAQGGNVPVVVGRGEYMVPPEAMGVMDMRARGRGFAGVNDLFRKVSRKHYMAGGGQAFHGHAMPHAGVAKAATAILKRFPGLSVTATTDGNHVPGSYHYSGNAVDLGGDFGILDKAAGWIKGSGMAKQLAEGIHNPNLAVKFGKIFKGQGPFGSVWAGHRNHIHLAVVGALSGKFGSAAQKIARKLIGGPDSPLKRITQGAINATTKAANRKLSSMGSVGDTSGGAGGPVSGSGAGLMKQIAKARGWNFADWWALDGSESSHGQNLVNPNSTARLRGQFLDMNWGKYGPGSDPRQHPSMAQQIQSMAQYIAQRYVNPTKAWAFHKAHNFYAGGGIAGKAKARFATTPKKAKKAPKGKKHHFKTIGHVHAHGGPKAFAPEMAPTNVAVDRINGILSDTGKVARWTDLYNIDSNNYDLNPLTFIVTNDPHTGAPVTPFIDQGAVDTRIGQLNTLLNLQSGIVGQLRLADSFLHRIIPSLTRQIRHKTKEIVRLRERIKKNLKRIKALKRQLSNLGKGGADHHALAVLRQNIRDEESKKKPDKAKLKAWRDQIANLEEAGRNKSDKISGTRKALSDEITKLETQNKHWGGSGTSVGAGGAIGTLINQRDNMRQSLTGVKGDALTVHGASGKGGALGDATFTIAQLNQQLVQLGAPALKDQLTQATGTGAAADDQGLADDLRLLLDQANQRFAVSQAQYGVLNDFTRGFPPFGGSFDKGGVVPGQLGEPRMILAHGGEVVTPPERLNGVHVVVEDNRIRVYHNGVEQEVEKVTGRQARKAGRRLPGAGGGIG